MGLKIVNVHVDLAQQLPPDTEAQQQCIGMIYKWPEESTEAQGLANQPNTCTAVQVPAAHSPHGPQACCQRLQMVQCCQVFALGAALAHQLHSNHTHFSLCCTQDMHSPIIHDMGWLWWLHLQTRQAFVQCSGAATVNECCELTVIEVEPSHDRLRPRSLAAHHFA